MESNVLVNGVEKKFDIEAGDYLVDVLRDNGYKSVKRGCEKSSCGACSVIVNNKIIISCTYLAIRADGKTIETLEGLQNEAAEVGEEIVNRGAEQCGYCSPGLVITAIQMKRDLGTKVSKEEIVHYINGNLCRCSGYVEQLEGIMRYMEVEE